MSGATVPLLSSAHIVMTWSSTLSLGFVSDVVLPNGVLLLDFFFLFFLFQTVFEGEEILLVIILDLKLCLFNPEERKNRK